MFDMKKTLIIVYKDELLVNQLRKMIETDDDTDEGIVGTKDNSLNVVVWTEKVWLANKKAGNIQGKILFIGDIKGTDVLIPVIDVKFDKHGVKFGWAGDQAVLFVDSKVLTSREAYDNFLEELSELPVPDILMEDSKESNGDEKSKEKLEHANKAKHDSPAFLKAAKKAFENGADAIEKAGNKVASKTEETFRDKSLMKKQMLFYGIIHLYYDGLELFMNQ